MFSPKAFVQSLRYAFKGLYIVFKEEQSFRLQLLVSVFVLLLMVIFPLERWARTSLLLAISIVLVLELLNSTMERVVDIIKPRFYQKSGEIKDVMAAAVLIASLTALIIGILIFVPYLPKFLTFNF